MTNSSQEVAAARILRLKIERFRGIRSLLWWPEPGVNLILGGGDVGKTTVLEAISLLLSPTNTTVLSDADYFGRQVEPEFVIEAAMAIPEIAGMSQQNKMAWLWEWDGKELQHPNVGEAGEKAGEARPTAYRVRVRGTAESDVSHEILNPDGSVATFSVAVRRAIGLVRLSGDDRNDRDLRLVQGSALDRLLDDKGLRARLGLLIAQEELQEQLKDDAKKTLAALDATFRQKALPSSLGLGLTGGPGLSLGALVGLTAASDGVSLPLASWGAGTRRLAALAIASSLQRERPITVVDELERGLEAYRQRRLMAELEVSKSQVFVTTHSAAAIHASGAAALWHIDATASIARLEGKEVERHRGEDPETFLARLAIIAEGATERGFVVELLQRAIGDSLLVHGIWVARGGGNDPTLALLENLSAAGLTFAGFADDEGRSPTRWGNVKAHLGDLLFRWTKGCLEDNVIPLFKDQLRQLIEDPATEKTGMRYRSLADRLGIAETTFEAVSAKAGADLVKVIVETATGRMPAGRQDLDAETRKQFEKHGRHWFKTESGGRELADKVLRLGVANQLEGQLLPFVNAVRRVVGLAGIAALSA